MQSRAYYRSKLPLALMSTETAERMAAPWAYKKAHIYHEVTQREAYEGVVGLIRCAGLSIVLHVPVWGRLPRACNVRRWGGHT